MSRKRQATRGSRDASRPYWRERSSAGIPRSAILGVVAVVILLVAAPLGLGLLHVGGSGATPQAAPTATPTPTDEIVAGRGGHWTNVTADKLAEMFGHKDFTLVNVKTPYVGEIDGTDLYIPYDQLTARKAELPADHAAKILVYCRTGTTSAIAAQTLLDLGYTNVWNLAGGMNAWQASGRQLVDRHRT